MADVALSTMLTQALREADAEGHLDMLVAADRLRVVDYVNAGLARLHDILTEAFEDYQLLFNAVGSPLTIAAPNSSVQLSTASITNLLKVRFVEHWPSGTIEVGAPIDVEPLNVAERNRYTGPRAYMLSGTTGGGGVLRIYPTADAPGVYRLWYTPTFTLLVADGDTFPSINEWHRWGVLDAAIKLRQDMDRDASLLVQRQVDLTAHIKSIASRRISGRPAKVRKVRRSMSEWIRDAYDPNRWNP